MPRVNTVTDGRDSDPASPDRLNRFHASSPSTGASWDSGTMAYDGSGNLKSIGADTYTYDQSSRLLSGTAGGERQDYTYDAFGNITQIAHTDAGGTLTTRSIGVVPSTNRLSVATYDAAGNLTSWAGNTYTWDALGSLVQFNGGQNGGGTYLYDVEDRRVAVLKSPDNSAAAKDETYILRSLAGQTLREFTVTGIDSPATRAWQKDYLYAAGNLLASVKTDGAGGEDIRHYHRDHLGSPRLITDASGSEVGRRTYLPYGEMVTDTASDETHKYTLHERDENFAGTDDDLDYMLARYYSPHLGRFLSCDPERGRAERLQTLNRYAYAWGNPVKHVDPDGKDPCNVIYTKDGGVYFECGGSTTASSGEEEKKGNPGLPGEPCNFSVDGVEMGTCGDDPVELSLMDRLQQMQEHGQPCKTFEGKGQWAGSWNWVIGSQSEHALNAMQHLLQVSYDSGGNFAEYGMYAYLDPSGQIRFSQPVTQGDPERVFIDVAPEHQGTLLFAVHTHPKGRTTSGSLFGRAGDAAWADFWTAPIFSASSAGGIAMVTQKLTGGRGEASAAWAYFGRGPNGEPVAFPACNGR